MEAPETRMEAGLWSTGLRTWWQERRTPLLCLTVVVLAVAAAVKLGSDVPRLLWAPPRAGAIDLALRHREVQAWFAGRSVYHELQAAIYPPATYVMLWPFVGWLDLTAARWLWAASALLALACLACFAVAGSGAIAPLERALAALLPLAMNATGMAVGNGQLTLHVLTLLIVASFLLRGTQPGWARDLTAAFLVVLSLAKPSLSIPFLPLLLVWGGTRLLLFVGTGYVALTLTAAWFQSGGVMLLLSEWMALSVAESARFGYANLSSWLGALGLQPWDLSASLLVLGASSAWLYRHRRADTWLLIGVAAIIARLWMYHQVYDDVLILLPMIALFRVAKRAVSPGGRDLLAGVLLAVTTAAMLLPTRFSLAASPWQPLFSCTHTAVWLVVLAFLLRQVALEPKTAAA